MITCNNLVQNLMYKDKNVICMVLSIMYMNPVSWDFLLEKLNKLLHPNDSK